VKEEKLNRNEVKYKLLLPTDWYGNTTRHQMIEEGSLGILETFWVALRKRDVLCYVCE